MKNFISKNIKHLCEVNFLKQNEFGEIFGLNKSVISTYVSNRATPKIETIQHICSHFEISIDNFINHDLRDMAKADTNVLGRSFYVAEDDITYTKDVDQQIISDLLAVLTKRALEKIEPTLLRQQKEIDAIQTKIASIEKQK